MVIRPIILIALFAALVRPAAADPPMGILLPPGTAPCTLHVNGLTVPLATGTPLTTRYDWDFADETGKFNHLTGFNAAHVYDRAGKFNVKLTVTDSAGAVQTT